MERVGHLKIPIPCDYPKVLRLKEFLWKISLVKRIKGKSNVGECDFNSRIIRVKKDLSISDSFSTLLHEYVHSIDHEYEVGLTHDQVYRLEKAIHDTWVGNEWKTKEKE